MKYLNLSIDEKETLTVIKDFIKTYVENSKCNGVVIGLSGGIDSALAAIICKQVLGKSKTHCIFLPESTTPNLDSKHHELLVKKFDLLSKKIDISDVVNQLSKSCCIKPDKFSLANIKARARMLLLYQYANMKKLLVCGTSNKSELLIGYFTKYGDGGADIMPLGDLYKTQVRQLAEYLKIPKQIISKPPTAGLWRGQSDEDEFKMNYKQLDVVLVGLERKINEKEIAKIAKLKVADVQRIKKMRINSQHKRRSPLIPKLGLRTPGLDWRSPIQLG